MRDRITISDLTEQLHYHQEQAAYAQADYNRKLKARHKFTGEAIGNSRKIMLKCSCGYEAIVQGKLQTTMICFTHFEQVGITHV